MRLTGRFSEDERHKYILIDGAEHTSATCSQSQDYQPSHAELSFCKELFKHRSVEGSEQIMYTTAKKLFTKATRNGFTGKLEVHRGHVAESAKTVSSLVKISAGDYLGRIAQIRYFLDFEVAEKAIEIAIVTLFTNEVQTDVDCGLSWVDTSNKENKAFLLEDISRPLVTATDDSAGHVLWLLNFDNV